MSLPSRIRKSIFGYDIFISYSRKDSLDYAYAIAQYFMRKGYECYIDQLSSITPGKALPANIKDAVKRSSAFVLIGSESAQTSTPIGEEIALFLRNNKNRPLIPITIEGAICADCIWIEQISGLALIDDTRNNLVNSTPAQDVLDRIENALQFTKKSTRLRNIAVAILVTALALTSYVFYEAHAANLAKEKADTAISNLSEARQQLTKVRKEAEAAAGESRRIKDSLGRTYSQLVLVKKDIENTKKQLTQKEKDLMRLQTQVISTSKAKDSIEKVAVAAKEEADRYERVSTARKLANQAVMYEKTDPQLAILLASYACRQFGKNEEIDANVESTLRQIMTGRSGTALSGHYEKMRSAVFNHAGTLAATGDGAGVIKLWNVSNPDSVFFLHNLFFDNEAGNLKFSKDDRYLFACFSDRFRDSKLPLVLKIWDVSDNQKPVLQYVDTCRVAGISDDGEAWALIDKDERISVYDIHQTDLRKPVKTWDASYLKHIDGLTFSDSKHLLAADTHDSAAYVWRTDNPDTGVYKSITTRNSGVFNLAFTPDDQQLLVASGYESMPDTLYSLYPMQAKELNRKILFVPGTSIQKIFLRDSLILAVCENGNIYRYDDDSMILFGAAGTSSAVSTATCSKDNKTLLLATEEGTVYQMNDFGSGFKMVNSFKLNNERTDILSLSPDSRHVVVASQADKIPLYLTLAVPEQTMKNGEAPVLADVSANKKVSAFYAGNQLSVYEYSDTAGMITKGQITASQLPSVQLSPDGKWMLVSTDSSEHVAIYGIDKSIQKKGEFPASLYERTFSEDSRYLLTRNDSSTILYLLSDTGAQLASKKVASNDVEYDEVSFSPDGKWLYMTVTEENNSTGISGKLVYLPSAFESDSFFAVKGLTGSYKRFAFSAASDRLFCMDGYNGDSATYHMYVYRLTPYGSVRLYDSLTNENDPIQVLQTCEAGNLVVIKKGKELYCSPADEITDGGGRLRTSDEIDADRVFITADGKWVLGFDRDLPAAMLWHLNDDDFLDVHYDDFKVPLPFKNASSFAQHFFSSDSKYLGIYSESEPSVFMYPLRDTLAVDSAFTLLCPDSNNVVGKVDFSPDGDTLYVLNHNERKTAGCINRYVLHTRKEFPLTIIPELAYGADFTVDKNNSAIITYSHTPVAWKTDFASVFQQAQNVTGRNFTLSEWRRLSSKLPYRPVFDNLPFDETYFYNFFSSDSLWGYTDTTYGLFNRMEFLDDYINKSQDYQFCILAGTYSVRNGKMGSATKAFARSEYLSPGNDWIPLYNAYLDGYSGKRDESIKEFNALLLNDRYENVKELIEQLIRKLDTGEKLNAGDWHFFLDMYY